MGAAITGWGGALPPHTLDNAQLATMFDVSEDWIFQRTGIRSRRIVSEGETTSSLAIEACGRAIQRAGIPAEAIDLVLVATSTPINCPPPRRSCNPRSVVRMSVPTTSMPLVRDSFMGSRRRTP